MQEFFSDVYLLRHFSQQKYWNRTKIMFVLLSIEIYKAVMYLARIYSWWVWGNMSTSSAINLALAYTMEKRNRNHRYNKKLRTKSERVAEPTIFGSEWKPGADFG